jgi:hypothetical protein
MAFVLLCSKLHKFDNECTCTLHGNVAFSFTQTYLLHLNRPKKFLRAAGLRFARRGGPAPPLYHPSQPARAPRLLLENE